MNKNPTLFRWQGIDAHGHVVNGDITAQHRTAAGALLRRQGITVQHLTRKRSRGFSPKNPRVPRNTLMQFTRQWAALITAGVPLLQTFDVIAKTTTHLGLLQLLRKLRQQLEQGHTINQALAQYPQYFDSVYRHLIAAGEQSGTLDTMLQRLATQLEKVAQARQKIRRALTYPCAVLVIAGVVITILLTQVIPRFEQLFTDAGATLPWPTRLVLQWSHTVQHTGGFLLLLGVIAIAALIGLRRRSLRWRRAQDQVCLRLPYFGALLQHSIMARMLRTLATLLAAGMPLTEALSICAKTANNSIYETAFIAVHNTVCQGRLLHHAMQQHRWFAPRTLQLCAIGEETGQLEILLHKAAQLDEDDLDTHISRLSSLLEPVMMSVLGIIVGGLVVAMYLPIFNIGRVF